MTRFPITAALFLAFLAPSVFANPADGSAELSPGQKAVRAAADQSQFAFILFYRTNDEPTGNMHQTLQSTLANRNDVVTIPVQISDTAEQDLITQFDATRLPLPAVAVLAPNGAITSVFPQRVAPQQLTAAIVSSGQAACLKALQHQRIVLLCVQPEGNSEVPEGVRDFQADDLYKNRTDVIHVQANDPAEARFLQQLRLRTDQPNPVVAFMAPPGVMLGAFNANVTMEILAQKLAAAGKCCDDANCKHHRPASSAPPQRR